ncbi:nitroreductase family deazaflavin-dependent oxidoreductase [Occultella glacieicola]|uniref:Nitroreductase family deazaflavin-dependent oxidoreductase n=1 Tax=Occultella glacieicola TaxID=2518684 RepID=A0ABY2DXQ9_9MICO|nr:nitroreductase family deazaflavin-dependent oxidoreductase [Occultella glacieicola]TDE88925.1 nitroreductase family deazaflavin-dependent oxidoreductase [Occultella glacieicola]
MSPLSRKAAERNKKYLNPVMRHVAPRLPGFGLLTHTGRRSGAAYTIPVNVFVRDGAYVFALTYGPETDWVRNVLAAGGARVRTRGRTVELTDPVLGRDEKASWAPFVVARILRATRSLETLTMRER